MGLLARLARRFRETTVSNDPVARALTPYRPIKRSSAAQRYEAEINATEQKEQP